MPKTLETLTDITAGLLDGRCDPIELVERSILRMDQHHELNAFVAFDEDMVRASAQASMERRAVGKPLSSLDGVPLAVKDNYLTKDYPTTACSHALPLEPAGQDASIVANLRAAGAIILGKTNMHEWAYGATNGTSSFGPTRNPRDPSRITGGSSGGTAVAVATGIVSAGLGSDTGGSVRIPSAGCGIYGFKPSYGRASRHGVLPLSWTLDAPGPMATSIQDIELLLPYFLGPDRKDLSTFAAKPFGRIPAIEAPKLLNLVGSGLERSDEVNEALIGALSRSGAHTMSVEMLGLSAYFSSWEAILHCEASAYHADLLKQNPEGFSPVTLAHLKAGQEISAVEYLDAQSIRSAFIKMLMEELAEWDALVLPTLPVVAPKHDEAWQEFGGKRVTTQDSMTWFCWLGNLAGLPCVTIPIPNGQSGLPVGMMLMGRPGKDEDLLAVAKWMDARIGS